MEGRGKLLRIQHFLPVVRPRVVIRKQRTDEFRETITWCAVGPLLGVLVSATDGFALRP